MFQYLNGESLPLIRLHKSSVRSIKAVVSLYLCHSLTDRLHLCPICLSQMPRVWWTSTLTMIVTWMLLTYLSGWSMTSQKSHRDAEATSLAQHPCRWDLFIPFFPSVLLCCLFKILFKMFYGSEMTLFAPLSRSWHWERKVLNVSCPSWNVWWNGVKTSMWTPTLRPAWVRHWCTEHECDLSRLSGKP